MKVKLHSLNGRKACPLRVKRLIESLNLHKS
jgi:hypothetical protein